MSNLQNKLDTIQPMLITGKNVEIDSNNNIRAQFRDVKINDLSDCVSNIDDFNNSILLGTTDHGTLSNAINNIGIGLNALKIITSGQNNIAVGKNNLQSNTTGSTNISIGSSALENNSSGQGNVSIGHQSGSVNTTGQNNTFIGKSSGATATYTGLSNATAVGYNAKVNTDNTIQLGNTTITDVKTAGKMTLGSVKYTNVAGTSGQFLKYDGAGNASWADISENIAITNLQNGTDISFNNAAIELRSIKSLDASGTLVDDITNLRKGTEISFTNESKELRSI